MHFEIFSDQLEPAGEEPIQVLARVEVVKTENGGRKGPFTKAYRPNHNFGSPDNKLFFIGQVEVPEGVWVHPGDSRDLRITFLNVQGLSECLTIGREWRIQEGSKLVASAKLLSFVHET
jgi:elongation factor Tu